MAAPVIIEYEGIRELAQALKEVDAGLLAELKADLGDAGDVVRDESARLFAGYGSEHGNAASFAASASTFETRVRVTGSSTALLVVGQRRRKSSNPARQRPQWGGLEMRHGLLPGRAARLEEAARILEEGAGRLLRNHGF